MKHPTEFFSSAALPRTTSRGPRMSRGMPAIWLVAEREIWSKLRSRAFLISTAVISLICIGGVAAGAFAVTRQTAPVPVAVTVDVAGRMAGVSGLEITEVADRPAAEALVSDGTVDAAIVADSGPLGIAILADSSPPSGLLLTLAQVPPVELLHPSDAGSGIGYLVGVGFGVLFLMAASMFGGTIAQSVIEEKQTRIVEILLATVSDRQLMAGKVLGNTILAMAQVLLFAAIALAGLGLTGQAGLLGALAGPIAVFAVFFLFGFVLLAALFAAAGAMVSRQEDVAATTFPLTALIVAPYLMVISMNDNPAAIAVLSYVPFSAPVAMPMRLFLGQAAWWELVVSLALLVATCAGAIWVGARIYSNSLLRMGARVKLREALQGGR